MKTSLLKCLEASRQSGVQTGVVKALEKAKGRYNEASREAARHRVTAVSDGVDSGVEPSEVNADLARRASGVSQAVGDIGVELEAWERVVSGAEDDQSLESLLPQILDIPRLAEHQTILRGALDESFPDGVAPVWAVLSKEDQAILHSGGQLNHVVRGSLNRENLTAKEGQDVVLLKVPTASVIMRGDWAKMEVLVSKEGISIHAPAAPAAPAVAETATEDAVPPVVGQLEATATAVGARSAECCT